jgi:hypothetical protein
MFYLRDSSDILVSAMIEVAIAGLYSDVVKDGLAAGRWQEEQLPAIEKQLATMDLFRVYSDSIRFGERGHAMFVLETSSRTKLARLFAVHKSGTESPWLTKQGAFLLLCPQGWLRQNQRFGAHLEQMLLDAVDSDRHRVDPIKMALFEANAKSESRGIAPYSFLGTQMVPNLVRATQVVARNQILIDLARIACGLEQYRRKHGGYPETLAALRPAFLDSIPNDSITGEPLSYRRTTDDRYLLYSVGWDGKDDGGTREPTPDAASWQGPMNGTDWVWNGVPKPRPAKPSPKAAFE